MDSKQLIKYALIGVGAYLIYKQFFGQTVQASSLPPGQTGTGAGAGTNPPPTQPPTNTQVLVPSPTQVTESQLILWSTNEQAAASAPSSITYTIDEWNYYRQKGGQPYFEALVIPGITNENRGTIRFSAPAYWAAGKAAGLAGLRGGFGAQAFTDQYRNYSWLM